MKLLLKAIVSGFGFSVGAFAWKKLSKQLGLDDEADAKKTDAPQPVPAPDTSSNANARA